MKNLEWKQIFYISFVVLIFSFLLYFYFLGNIYLLNNRIENNTKLLNQQNIQIEKIKTEIGYDKFDAVRKLENQSKAMPWFDHITKIIAILNSLKSVDSSETDSVILTDFNVSLDKISLRGKVSNLYLLYYSSPQKGVQSLIDKFESLDFIKNMTIQSYNRVDENYFEFVLEAKIINDATK